MPPRPGIGRAEQDILRYIQDHHPISVREVADHLAETKGHTRTTALNIMERLREKGHLTRDKVEGVYLYSPSQPKAEQMRTLVKEFVEGMLGGSLDPFVAYLTHEARLSGAQLQELRQLLNEIEPRSEEP